jgi:hypothetical protein
MIKLIFCFSLTQNRLILQHAKTRTSFKSAVAITNLPNRTFSTNYNSTEDEDIEIFVEEDYSEEQEIDDEDVSNNYRPPKWMIEPKEIVAARRAQNIEVVYCDNPISHYRFLVIASPITDRQGSMLREDIRVHFCRKYDFGVSFNV